MYRPTIKSNLWLGLMTLVFLLIYYWAENDLVVIKSKDYQEKVNAAEIMRKAIDALQNYRLPGIDNPSTEGSTDRLINTMLGEKDSPITTDEGSVDEKLTVLNPNFSAAVVDLFSQCKLETGDTIAVFVTGSLPGANIAVYSAIKAMDLNPIIITSVGSSWWGANRPDFTWLDMEKVLSDAGVFPYRSIAASIGGKDDNGGIRLSEVGINLISKAIDRNGAVFINEGSLTRNIQGRLKILKRVAPLESYKAAVNVGGGIATVGPPANARLIPQGFSRRLPNVMFPNPGSLIHYFNDENVPTINISDVTRIAKDYRLRVPPAVSRKIGDGQVYQHERYNLTSAIIALVMMLVILVVVKYFDRQRYKWREEKVESDQDI